MKSIAIKGTVREVKGTSRAKQFRNYGLVPCILYGENDPIHFASPINEFKDLVYTSEAHFVELDLEGKKSKAIMQEIQFHPVSEQILHIDFLEIQGKKPVTVEVPVTLVGAAAGVRLGGRLIQKLRRLKIKGLPTKLPETIEVDVTDLGLGASLKVGEIALEGLKVVTPAGIPVVTIMRPRSAVEVSEEDDDDAEGAATAEGDEASENKE
ncbi:MAG: large subunit ribosomal protein L25 [Sphingobacteriales bacterium]|jgi:large subunit ribosomal protein L25